MEINYFRNQAQELQGQIQLLQKVLEDLDSAKKSLTVTDALNHGTLLPLGAGVFAKAKTDKTGTVLFDVGARVLVEKKPDEAIVILDTRKAMIEKNLVEVNAAFDRILERVAQLTAQAEHMANQSA